ncbi:FHA domain-containing protein [Spirillospora sp. NPDC048819]|uniref:FHA domain-containing protein n=1 Tax=Spirillospora sp. NPDC048819 TaxID=3155268 RepID=UPI0033F10989
MPVCPSGHTSEAADYCDVCGDLMDGAKRAEFAAPAPAPTPDPTPDPAPAAGPEAGPGKTASSTCPHCDTPRSGRFCEVDGYDFETGALHTAQLPAPRPRPLVPSQRTSSPRLTPPGPSALIVADREYFDTVIAQMGPDAAGLKFPPYSLERRVPLIGDQVRIGRRSTSRAILPEIDLSAPPEDPGVSHLHAVLLAQPDGTWNLVDPGSTNGTTVNGGTDPIGVNTPVPMADGDRIHVGAWTTITLSLQEGPP